RRTSRRRAQPENICCWRTSWSSRLGFAQFPALLVVEPAACFLAQVAPDLRHIAPERLARDDFGAARTGQSNLHDTLHLAGPIGHPTDAVGELHRLGDVVGN